MCDGSRTRRIASTWLGPWLIVGIGIASSGELAAMSPLGAGPQLSRPILVQQPSPGEQPGGTASEDRSAPDSFSELHEALAAARERLDELSRAAEAVAASGELQRELATAQEQNQKLRAEIDALRAERDELAKAQQEAEARAAELNRTAEQATAAAQEIDQELVSVRWQNAQLNTSLKQEQARRDQIEVEARAAQAALRTRVEELEAAAAAATSEAMRLRAQLDATEQQIASTAGAEAEAERQLAEWRERVREADQAQAAADDRAAGVEAQLADLKEQLAAAEQERTQAVQRIADLEVERDTVRGQLTDVSGRLEEMQAANGQLENEVDQLRDAAATATELARRNLIAVEDRIRELNGTLQAIEPAGGPQQPDPSRSDLPGAPAGAQQAANGAASSISVASVASAAPDGEDAGPVRAGSARSEVDLDRVKMTSAVIASDGAAPPMLADLPLEKRLHVQGLLADLDSKMDGQGLTTIVPGGLLFAVDSETVQEGAHDTLAKVAELISVYDDRKVLIVGHTDAVGDAAYNKQLSERRAELVKQFFVDNFEVEEDRLSTRGLGEERPITSDATQEGRRANRRVEVLILN
jgi:outer membrane protein OmpA-like peptidoglycan-associated protein